MNKKLAIGAALLAVCGGYSVYAEELPVYTLDAVVVTATRTPEKVIDANANVDVVTAKDIETHHYASVPEAVRKVPGVVIANYTANSQAGTSNQIIINGSKNIVVLVDGMRMNTNGSSMSSSDIGAYVNMDSIDHIEVLKGSASTLYGSDAQGGVINIITKKAENGTMATKVGAAFGSYDGETYNFHHEGAENGLFWSVDAQKQLQGDFKDGWGRKAVNHLNSKTYGVKLGKEFDNGSDLIFQYWKYKGDYTRPAQGTNDPTGADGSKNDDRISLQYNAKINVQLANAFSVYRNNTRYNDFKNGGNWDRFQMDMKTTGISDQLTYTGNNQTIIGGFDWYKDEIPSYFQNPTVEGQSATNTAFYVQDKWDIDNQWNVTPGVRVDHHSIFGNHTSPSLSVGYKPNESTNYYVSYKEFFIAPSLFQLYYGYGGNQNLKPEEGYTVEAGINHEFDESLSGSLNVYHQHAKNLINWVTLNPVTYDGLYMNTGEVDINGINASLNKKFNDHVSAYVGYGYINADLKAAAYANLPKHKLSVGVDYTNGNYDLGLDGVGVMDRYSKSAVMDKYNSYWVWNLHGNYHVGEAITVYGRINNVFNQFYTDIGTSRDPYGAWYSAPGRNYEVGVSFQF